MNHVSGTRLVCAGTQSQTFDVPPGDGAQTELTIINLSNGPAYVAVGGRSVVATTDSTLIESALDNPPGSASFAFPLPALSPEDAACLGAPHCVAAMSADENGRPSVLMICVGD